MSLAAYVHAIYALLAQSQAQQILMIGCGGGTLGTMLAAAARQVTIVDINPERTAVFFLAFAHHLPRRRWPDVSGAQPDTL